MLKYNFILYIVFPFILLKLIFYILRNSAKFSYLKHKLFGVRLTSSYSIWLHAASVGEMKIALRITRSLIDKGFKNILITSNTPSSKLIFEEAKLDNVDHHYLPFDFFFTTKKFVKSISAELLIIIETEIWPIFTIIAKCTKLK